MTCVFVALLSPLPATAANAAASCPMPPGSTDHPVVTVSFEPGHRSPLLTWNTTCPSLAGFRVSWNFWREDNTTPGPLAWQGPEYQLQLPEPEDALVRIAQVMVQNLDFGGGAGLWGASFPLQVVTPSVPGTPSLTDNGEGRVTVAWTAPANQGGQAPSYIVTTTPATAGCQATDTTCLLQGLRPDTTYQVTVSAQNVAGQGPASAASSITLRGPRLSAPTGVAAKAKGRAFTVTWSAPRNASAGAKVRYEVRSSPAGLTCRSSRTTCTTKATRPGTSMRFVVTAIRGVQRVDSRPSPYVTIPAPMAKPSAPSTTAPNPVTPRPEPVKPEVSIS